MHRINLVTVPLGYWNALDTASRIAALAGTHTLTGGLPPWLLTFAMWMHDAADGAQALRPVPTGTLSDPPQVLPHPRLVENALHDRQVTRCARYLERRLSRAGIDLDENPYPVGALLVLAHIHQQHKPAHPLRTRQALRLLASLSDVELEFLSLDHHGSKLRDRRGDIRAEVTAIDKRLQQLMTHAIPRDDSPFIVSDRGWSGIHPRANRR